MPELTHDSQAASVALRAEIESLSASNAERSNPAVVYIAEGRTEHIRHHVLETPDAAEALEHALKCWLVLGCREVSLRREGRKPENDQALRPAKLP